MAATLTFISAATIFLSMTVAALWHLRWVRRLPALAELEPATPARASSVDGVRCSVVIAARDEEARIEGTVHHLFAQQGVAMELIVVDDRSTDRTGEILQRLAMEDPHMQVKRVDKLPEGWLGKCHACHVGAGAARGDWILFTDADCWLKPDVVARALLLAEREAVDHVTLTPGVTPQSFPARSWHLMFLISMVNWLSGVNRDKPKSYLGIGAFNLVRTAAYRQCGGYETLRLTVVDDLKLGLLLRRANKRTRGFLGVSDVKCHWGTTLREMVRLMEKNYFAVTEFRLWLVAAGSLAALMVFGILVAGLTTGTAAGLVAALSPFSLVLPAGILARRLGWSWRCALFVPFMLPVFLYTLLNSTWVTLRQGGIRWRDTFYSLETLRAGAVR